MCVLSKHRWVKTVTDVRESQRKIVLVSVCVGRVYKNTTVTITRYTRYFILLIVYMCVINLCAKCRQKIGSNCNYKNRDMSLLDVVLGSKVVEWWFDAARAQSWSNLFRFAGLPTACKLNKLSDQVSEFLLAPKPRQPPVSSGRYVKVKMELFSWHAFAARVVATTTSLCDSWSSSSRLCGGVRGFLFYRI